MLVYFSSNPIDLFQYLGSVEVLCSMKTLDFDSRTRVARDSIRLVCIAVGVPLKDRRKVCKSIKLFIEKENILFIS
jgi:hypothetical protein